MLVDYRQLRNKGSEPVLAQIQVYTFAHKLMTDQGMSLHKCQGFASHSRYVYGQCLKVWFAIIFTVVPCILILQSLLFIQLMHNQIALQNVKICIKIYMRGVPTCFGFSQPSSGSYYMCFAQVMISSNQLKYVVYRNSSVQWLHIYPVLIGVCVVQPHSAQCTARARTHTHTHTTLTHTTHTPHTHTPHTHTHTPHTHTHTQFVYQSLLSHYNNGCTNAPQCYVIRTLLVLSAISDIRHVPDALHCRT